VAVRALISLSTAAPPSSAMNSRRFIQSPCRRARSGRLTAINGPPSLRGDDPAVLERAAGCQPHDGQMADAVAPSDVHQARGHGGVVGPSHRYARGRWSRPRLPSCARLRRSH
jgi:hypothetical protein